jgi:hypothetical protein
MSIFDLLYLGYGTVTVFAALYACRVVGWIYAMFGAAYGVLPLPAEFREGHEPEPGWIEETVLGFIAVLVTASILVLLTALGHVIAP